MNHRANLKHWIESRRTTVGAAASTSYVSEHGLLDYRALLESIAARTSRSMKGHTILTGVTCASAAGAWAYRDGMSRHTHVVVVSQGLMTRIQQFTSAARDASLANLSCKDGPEDFKSMWGDLPVDSPHATGFARLLAHVAFVLLAHHEFAHIIIGHGYFGGSGNAVVEIDEVEELATAGATPTSTLVSAPESVLRSHAFETDADMHALVWTDRYLEGFNPESPSLEILDAATKEVHLSLLRRDEVRRFIVVAASWVLFAALGGKTFTPEDLKKGSHPPTGMRLAMMVLHEHDLASQRDPAALPLYNAGAFGAQLIAFALDPRPAVADIVHAVGYRAALRNWDALLVHHNRLVLLRKRYDQRLRRFRLESGLPEVVWWEARSEPFRQTDNGSARFG